MILRSNSLGEIKVREDSILYLPDGVLGFEEYRRFVFMEVEEFRPFLWLLSTDEPDLGFAVADPQLFIAEPYSVPLCESDRDILDLQTGDLLSIFVIVSIPEGGRRITANLKGPVVLNTRNRLAKQVVIYNPSYSVRQPMLQPAARPLPTAAGVLQLRVSAGR